MRVLAVRLVPGQARADVVVLPGPGAAPTLVRLNWLRANNSWLPPANWRELVQRELRVGVVKQLGLGGLV